MLSCEEKFDFSSSQGKIPTISITTENKEAVNSKDVYIPARMTIEANKEFSAQIGIRGRGNTTWTYPKKPFKIKLHEKAGLLGLEPERRWVLLANYLDPSLMQNALAMELAHLLKMPYTNHIKPVDLWLNKEYLGSYVLTEQIEVQDNRVDIGENGILLSLDTIIEADDPYFRSTSFNLPVQIKHPEIKNESQIDLIRSEFEELERLVKSNDFPANNYLDFFDAESMANYLMVYTLTCNEEINHPKSTYLYKSAGGKFHMGPIWDFDWAFSFEQNGIHYANPNRPLFWERATSGKVFFQRIASDPAIKKLMKEKWQNFRKQDFNKLLLFVDDYSNKIADSRREDFKKWGRGNPNFNVEKENLKNWLKLRAVYMDELVKDY